MESPFMNDALAMVWKAFKNLHPDKECVCLLSVLNEETRDEGGPYGFTQFNDDGSVVVAISISLTLYNAIEVFAHELAHVAVGEAHEHDEAWDKEFDRILAEYNRIGQEMFIDGDSVSLAEGAPDE